MQSRVQRGRGADRRVLRSAQKCCNLRQREDSHLSKRHGRKPSRDGMRESGACGLAFLVCQRKAPPRLTRRGSAPALQALRVSWATKTGLGREHKRLRRCRVPWHGLAVLRSSKKIAGPVGAGPASQWVSPSRGKAHKLTGESYMNLTGPAPIQSSPEKPRRCSGDGGYRPEEPPNKGKPR